MIFESSFDCLKTLNQKFHFIIVIKYMDQINQRLMNVFERMY